MFRVSVRFVVSLWVYILLGIFQALQEAPVNDSPKGGVKGMRHMVHRAVCHSQLSIRVYSCTRVDRFAHAQYHPRMIPFEGLLKVADLDVHGIASGRQLCAWIHLQVRF